MLKVRVGDRIVGEGHPCFIIAEAGVNHNGDVARAHKLIDVAADARVDAVKFQTFDPDKVAATEAAKAAYQIETTGEHGSQVEMLRELVLPRSAHRQLMQHASDRGLVFLSTPFDEDSADFLEEISVLAFKVSSGDLTNLPFLTHLAKKGRPMLVSTGMAVMGEVAAALDMIYAQGNTAIALFHCVSNYPTAPADCNLRAMDSLRAAFRLPTGWSDHTQGIDITLAAVALGAELVEKHFTLDRNLPGPDHKASLEPAELRDMAAGIRRVESALGDGVKRPVFSELPVAEVGRRSLHWRRPLPSGTIVTATNLIALRPGTGISPAKMEAILNRRLARSVDAGKMVSEDDLDS